MIPQRIFFCLDCDSLSIFAQDLAQRAVKSMGFDKCRDTPQARSRSKSCASALAVIVTIGMAESWGSCNARMCRAAS